MLAGPGPSGFLGSILVLGTLRFWRCPVLT